MWFWKSPQKQMSKNPLQTKLDSRVQLNSVSNTKITSTKKAKIKQKKIFRPSKSQNPKYHNPFRIFKSPRKTNSNLKKEKTILKSKILDIYN